MKKTAFLILSILFTINTRAQEGNTVNKQNNNSIIVKPKLGFSELKIDDFGSVNGFHSAFEILTSSRITEKYNLEYGVGFSEFKSNIASQSSSGSIKNEYIYLPVNLIKSYNLKNQNTLQFGFGIYGNYLYKSKIESKVNEKNIGFNFGTNIQLGAKLKIAEESFFRIMLESQNEFTNFKKNNTEYKQINTNLLSLSFIHSF